MQTNWYSLFNVWCYCFVVVVAVVVLNNYVKQENISRRMMRRILVMWWYCKWPRDDDDMILWYDKHFNIWKHQHHLVYTHHIINLLRQVKESSQKPKPNPFLKKKKLSCKRYFFLLCMLLYAPPLKLQLL